MVVAIASIASARCAVRAAASILWDVFVPPAAQSEVRTTRNAAVLSATTAWRNITKHAAAQNAGKQADRLWFCKSRFTNLYVSITNIYACSSADVLCYGSLDVGK
jgi:hypothetical protein